MILTVFEADYGVFPCLFCPFLFTLVDDVSCGFPSGTGEKPRLPGIEAQWLSRRSRQRSMLGWQGQMTTHYWTIYPASSPAFPDAKTARKRVCGFPYR
jgi:hypothetical protein